MDEKEPPSWLDSPQPASFFPTLLGGGGERSHSQRAGGERLGAEEGFARGGGKKRLLLWQVSPLTEMASKAASEGEAEPRCVRLREEVAARG